MGWRTIIVKNYNKITLKNNNVVVEDANNLLEPVKYSLDEINAIIFENNYVLFSSKLMCALIKKDIFIIFTDDSHDPCGVLLPLATHCMPLVNLDMQLKITEDIKKSLWTKVIYQKLINQKEILVNLGIEEIEINKIEKLINSFQYNDITNREGLVAKIYFRCLFGSSFIRFENDVINNILNYGYKIISSALSRTLVQFGFNLYLGFHHIGRLNPFNLTYDLIEPYRPLVDEWIIENWDNINFEGGFSYNNRLELIKILNKNIMIDNKIMSVLSSMNYLVKSFVSTLKYQTISKLKLPTIINSIDNSVEEKVLEEYNNMDYE